MVTGKNDRKKLVVFDVDGTLFDTKIGIQAALNWVLNYYGIDSIQENEINKFIGPSIFTCFKEFYRFDDEKAYEAMALYRKIYVEKYIQLSNPYKGSFDVIIALKKQGVSLAIATMKTKSQTEKILDIFSMKKYFDEIRCAKEDGSLSKGQMLNDLKKLYSNYLCTMVGDTKGDFNAALEANYRFIYAKYGYGNLESESNILQINSLDELLQIS